MSDSPPSPTRRASSRPSPSFSSPTNEGASDIESIHRDIQKIMEKLDALPDRYVTRSEYTEWKALTSRLLEDIQSQQRADKQWGNDEHTKLAEAVHASEARIIQKIEERRQWKRGQIIMLLLTAVGWLLGVAEFILYNFRR